LRFRTRNVDWAPVTIPRSIKGVSVAHGEVGTLDQPDVVAGDRIRVLAGPRTTKAGRYERDVNHVTVSADKLRLLSLIYADDVQFVVGTSGRQVAGLRENRAGAQQQRGKCQQPERLPHSNPPRWFNAVTSNGYSPLRRHCSHEQPRRSDRGIAVSARRSS